MGTLRCTRGAERMRYHRSTVLSTHFVQVFRTGFRVLGQSRTARTWLGSK
jgi:hypothetical protein